MRINSAKRFRNVSPVQPATRSEKNRSWTPERSLQDLCIFSSGNVTGFELSLEQPIPISPACNIHRVTSDPKSRWWLWIISAVTGHSVTQKIQLLSQVLVIPSTPHISLSARPTVYYLLLSPTSPAIVPAHTSHFSPLLLGTPPCDSSLLSYPYHNLPRGSRWNEVK